MEIQQLENNGSRPILYRTEIETESHTSYFSLIWNWWSSSLGKASTPNRLASEEAVLGITLDLSINRLLSNRKISGGSREYAAEELSKRKPEAVLELVPIFDGAEFINTLKLLPPSQTAHATNQGVWEDFDFYAKDESKKNLVLTHGFGAGLGFFYRNYPQLSKMQNYNVFAIDWLGMGNSSRPTFPEKKNTHDDIEEADQFFTSSLEEWRKRMNIEKMTLMGHSLGGYLSVKYALKYPHRVEKLILISPVGVPKYEPIPPEKLDPGFRPSFFFKFAHRLWMWEVSPQSLLRSLGPFGQIITNRYATRRFELGSPTPEEKASLGEYIYQLSAGKGSGEYSAPRLLYPYFTGIKQDDGSKSITGGIYARTPLSDYFPHLTMPTTFIYGSADWMNHNHAVKSARLLNVPTKVAVVDRAGHHLYLDAPEGFNHAVMVELGEVSPQVTRSDVTYAYSSSS